MFPWTPPTSWPTPPQPTTTSSTWPPQPPSITSTSRPPMTWPTTSPSSHPAPHPGYPIDPHQYSISPTHMPGAAATPVEHLFGQPSALHPSWASTTSLPSTTHSTPPPTFTSLATSSHPMPAQHLFPSTPPTTSPDTTTFQTVTPTFAAPTGPPFSTAWPTVPVPVHEPSVSPAPSPLPSSPHPPRVHQPQPVATTTTPPSSTTPRHTAVKAAPKVRHEKKAEKPRRSTSTAPSTPTIDAPSAPSASPSVQQDLATLGTTAQQLAESVRLLQAQQHQLILDSQRLHDQQQQLRQALPPSTTPPTPLTTCASPPTVPPPAPKARPIEPTAPDHPTSTAPTAPIRVPSASPSNRPRSRPRRSRSPRPIRDARRRDSPRHRTQRPQSPLPRHRSTTKHPKGRRTPSPYRRRSPPRRHSPLPHRRHRSNPPQRSRTPLRPPRGHEVVLTPAARPSDPGFIHTPDADDTWGNWNDHHHPDDHRHETHRPRSPPGPPPSTTPAVAPLGAVTYRVATGDSDASEPDEAYSIATYDKCDLDIDEMKSAAEDPLRTRCVTELSSSHTVSIRMELDHSTKILFNNFIDEMFNQLARPYTTSNNEVIYIKASRATVTNMAKAFAQAQLLDLNLARKTQGFYVEPENLLTIAVPTGLPKKEIYRGQHAGTYLSYHKTSWESVAKILVENCIRPASWTKNEAGIPTQYPCYGFFGYSCEIADTEELQPYAIRLCTSNLYKIGKGQNPSGILAICRSPKCIRAQSGGNDQIQRLCALQGTARGKDGATAMNSNCASVSYVASTHSVFDRLITRTPTAARTSVASMTSEPTEAPPTDPVPPATATTTATAPTAPNPRPDHHTRATSTHNETPDRAAPDRRRHHWDNTSSWHDSSSVHRGSYSSHREGRSRDHHREGSSGYYNSERDPYRSRW